MVLNIVRNHILLTRGDTAVIEIKLHNRTHRPYNIRDGDELVFTLKDSTRSNNVILQKTACENQIKIEANDTKELRYGDYVYDVQLKKEHGEICTVIPPTTFTLMEEVNYG